MRDLPIVARLYVTTRRKEIKTVRILSVGNTFQSNTTFEGGEKEGGMGEEKKLWSR